jgi:hypothetical protein
MEQKNAYKVALTAATSTAVGGVLKLRNELGGDLIVKRLILDITTKSTGAATVDAGVHADGTASSDNLIDGLDVNAAAGVFDNLKNPGTNGKAAVKWKAGEYIVITASATVAGLVGNAYIEWVRV